MVRPNDYELKAKILYWIYETGDKDFEFYIELLTGETKFEYDRIKARNLITSYLNKFLNSQDKHETTFSSRYTDHIIFQLQQNQIRELCEMIETEVRGGIIKIDSEGPSVY